MNIIQMKSGDCGRCDGCGYVANSDDAEPWTAWANLPVQSAVAVQLGWVKPVPCPECDGSGNAVASQGEGSTE